MEDFISKLSDVYEESKDLVCHIVTHDHESGDAKMKLYSKLQELRNMAFESAGSPSHIKVHNEVSWAAEAGFVKTPEQMELIEQQAFENGHKETLRDAKAGLYAKSEEVYNATQVKMLINEAVRKHDQTTIIVLKKLQGMYKLPDAVDALIRDLELSREEVNCG